MRPITATVLDPTHLELAQPIAARRGEVLFLSVLDAGDDDRVWKEAARERLLAAYADEDALYDDL